MVCLLVTLAKRRNVWDVLGLGTSEFRRLGIKVYWELERASIILE